MAHSPRPTIGLFTPYTTTSWAKRQWEGVVEAARDLDVNLISYVGGALRYDEQANALYGLAVDARLDGLAVWSTAIGWSVPRPEMADFLSRYRHIPIVSLEMEFPGIPSVVMEDFQGMHAVVSHLIEEHGCRRIAFLRGAATHEGAEKRYRAYLAALEGHGLPTDPRLVPPPSDDWDGIAMMRTLLEEPRPDFDALIAVHDAMMLEVLPFMRERGIRVPGDVAVASFDDLLEGRSFTPPLTTAAPPFREMGRRAVEILLARLSGQAVPGRECMPIPLIVRESCGCPHPLLRNPAACGEEWALPEGASEDALLRLRSALEADARDGGRGRFLAALSEGLRATAEAEGEVLAWMGVLSGLQREAAWPGRLPSEERRAAEEGIGCGQALVTEVARRQIARRDLLSGSRQATLRSISEMLSATFDTEALMDIVARELPLLGIASCYLSLFAPQGRAEGARLILAYDERGRRVLPAGGVAFPASQLAPPGYLSDERRAARLVLSLDFQAERIGFVVFELQDGADASIHEALRWQLSSALKGAFLVQGERAVASEKDILLRELQHRVKNNIGIISSIVSIEAGAASAPETRGALDKLGSRIAALGALYDTLYDSGGLDRIDLSTYLGRVVDSAAESLGSDARNIAFDRSIASRPIDLKRAVSLGLIVNELVTDSIKHAFPGGRTGRISVSLGCEGGRYRLRVSDDGIGLPPGFERAQAKGFGLNLVELLVKQLEGELSFESGEGTRVDLAFAE
jgi:two-component sensor histidine kinase/DNA-binding LacI/PurR family transcriptional regulator